MVPVANGSDRGDSPPKGVREVVDIGTGGVPFELQVEAGRQEDDDDDGEQHEVQLAMTQDVAELSDGYSSQADRPQPLESPDQTQGADRPGGAQHRDGDDHEIRYVGSQEVATVAG